MIQTMMQTYKDLLTPAFRFYHFAKRTKLFTAIFIHPVIGHGVNRSGNQMSQVSLA